MDVEDIIYQKLKKYNSRHRIFVESLDEHIQLAVSGKLGNGVLGDTKIYSQTFNTDFIDEKKTLKINNEKFTYTEVAKAILKIIIEMSGIKQLWNKRLVKENILKQAKIYQPLYVRKGNYNKYAYVDIKSCYFTIFKKLYFSEYIPNFYIKKEISNKEINIFLKYLERNKSLRNRMVGLTNSNEIVRFSKNGLQISRTANKFFNPCFNMILSDVLNYVAVNMINKYKAVYCMIDGYILPYERSEDAINWLSEIGLKAGYKDVGDVEIRNIGTYKFYKSINNTYSKLIDKRDEMKQEIKSKICCFSDINYIQYLLEERKILKE